jgi:hypothetical protein
VCFFLLIRSFLRIRGFAYAPFALYAFGCGFADLLFFCGFADLLMRRLRYMPLAADSRICVFAVCVMCLWLLIRGFAYSPFALCAFGC